MTQVNVRGAKLEIRTVNLTKALLKQLRMFRDTPPEPFIQIVGEGEAREPKVNLELAVGWISGTVLGEESQDFILLARDGDLFLWRAYRAYSPKLFRGLKQLYL